MSAETPVKTILVLSANPRGTRPLRLDEEIREIEQGLQRSKKRESFAFKSGQAVRDFDIHRSILDHDPQIIHFSGHGTGEQGLVFEDNIGQQKLVDAEALAGLFELFALQIECVVLNACYSKIQAKAIAQHIDYVIGMSKEIGDAAAIKFAVGFYDALGAGRDVEFSYKLGCRVIRMAGIPEHLTPQLFRKKDYSGENIDTTPLPTSPPQDARNTTVISPPASATTPLVPRQEEPNIAQYRQKVEEFASDGVISDIESLILNHLQNQLRLTDEQARGVREEVLEPYEIYKQQFEKKVAEQGYPLREKAQAELKKLQNYYKIKDEYINLVNQEAEKQEAEKLRGQEESRRIQAQQEHENNLRRYEQELSKALKAGYPLNEFVRNGLKNFQQSLGLTNEDVAPIEQRLLAPKQTEYERQQQEVERLRQQKLEQQRLEYQRQQAELQRQREPKSPSIIQTQPFEFETATLTVKTITEKRPRLFGFLEDTSTSTSCDITRSRGRAESFKEDLGNGVFLEMVEIPGGSFLMGSPENELERSDYESPQHKVNIKPFFMGKFPVTQEQYQAIMGENPSHFQGKNKPVERVRWDNAVDFCGRISKRTGKTYRLPSEAEWEYACRAGTRTPFHFGETITTDLANYDGNYTYGSGPKGKYLEQTTDVGSFPANTFGLYDIHGNVWEWCQDSWHKNYQGAPNNGSAWNDNENNYRLLRGGSWRHLPRICRSAFRAWYERGNSDVNFGFRVVVACSRAS
ncbi:SUMF1/EgtB/PvdO family nonheme iron enzyme [Calothrix sp. CCY 0018]|uniref:SUMF1/EgtB/PvdO family nonheme iron enzyme n=1 Tax=Calothrix sp. CCY 0018 TaxID=3103864 RepID=UPI0039C5BFF5